MTLFGNGPERRTKAECGVRNVECRAPEALPTSRITFHASRFTLRLSCLTLPTLLLLAAGSALSYAESAAPYQAIVERNVFGLKPPAPPPDPETLKPPPPKLTLTGIMTIFGKKQALFKSPPSPAPPPKPGQPPEAPKEHSYILAEGQREDGITVLQIDDVAKSVKLDADGTMVTLTFPTNETKTASGPGGIPSPTGMGGAIPPPRVIPGRPLRIPGINGLGSSSSTSIGSEAAPNVAQNGTLGATAGGINGGGNALTFGSSTAQEVPTGMNPPMQMDPDAYAAMLEVQRERTAEDVKTGKLPPLPVTRYTPAGALGTLPSVTPDAAQNGGGNPGMMLPQPRPGMPQQLPQ